MRTKLFSLISIPLFIGNLFSPSQIPQTPSKIIIPSISLNETVVPADRWDSPPKNVGYLENNWNDTVFIYGHDYGVFKNLPKLKENEIVYILTEEPIFNIFGYKVEKIQVVDSTYVGYDMVDGWADGMGADVVVFTCYGGNNRILYFLNKVTIDKASGSMV